MAVILLVVMLSGVGSGKREAASLNIVASTQNLQKGLDYFYQDQNHFPTAVEFSDEAIMLNYFNNFPLSEIPSTVCSQTYIYKNISPNSYQFNFCLPTAQSVYKSGWNSLLVQK